MECLEFEFKNSTKMSFGCEIELNSITIANNSDLEQIRIIGPDNTLYFAKIE